MIFQPLLMPSLVFGVLFFGVPQATSIPESFKLRLFYLIVSSTLLIPMVLMLGLRWSGLIKSLHFEEKSDRRTPFVLVTFFYLLTTYFLKGKTELDPILWQGMGVITCSVDLADGGHVFLEDVCAHDRFWWAFSCPWSLGNLLSFFGTGLPAGGNPYSGRFGSFCTIVFGCP